MAESAAESVETLRRVEGLEGVVVAREVDLDGHLQRDLVQSELLDVKLEKGSRKTAAAAATTTASTAPRSGRRVLLRLRAASGSASSGTDGFCRVLHLVERGKEAHQARGRVLLELQP